MTLPLLILLCLMLTMSCALFGTLFLKRRASGNHWISLICKVLTAGCFCGVGCLMAAFSSCPWGWQIFHGLLWGLAGDFLLALRKIRPESEKLYFLLGIIAFSGGHFCYLSALHRMEPFSPFPVLTIFLILLICCEAFLIVHQVRDLKVNLPGLLYIGIEAFMSAMALNLAYSHTNLGTLLFATGSLSFFASDNLLTVFSFGDLKYPEVDQALHVTYWGAQLFIAWSILFL